MLCLRLFVAYTRMPVDTHANGCKRNFRQVVWRIALISQGLSVIMGAPSGNPLMTTTTPASAYYNCGGEYWVEHKATVISIPTDNNETPVSCTWLLKARDKHRTIALSTVKMELKLYLPRVSFTLEARDGWSEDSPLIGAVEVSTDIQISFPWKFLTPIKSNSGFLLLTYKNDGFDPLMMDIAFYSCGGEFEALSQIESPDFEGITLKEQIIDCEWKLKKPKNAFYGYLKPVDINITNCATLQMCSNESMRVLERVAPEQLIVEIENNSSMRNESLPKSNASLPTEENDLQSNFSCSQNGYANFMTPVCGDSLQLIVFESDYAILRYISYGDAGFKAIYDTFKIPSHFDYKPKRLPWYLNYCALTVFTPVGVFLGAIIILYQTRRRGPREYRPSVSGPMDEELKSESSPAEIAEHRYKNYRKPPAEPIQSCSDMNSFSVASAEATNNNNTLGEIKVENRDEQNPLLSDELSSVSKASESQQDTESSSCWDSEHLKGQFCEPQKEFKNDNSKPFAKNDKYRRVRFSATSSVSDASQV